MNKKIFSIASLSLAVLWLLIISRTASAWDNYVTHPNLINHAIDFLVDTYPIYGGLRQYANFSIETSEQLTYIDEGSVKEDYGYSVEHIYPGGIGESSWYTDVWGFEQDENVPEFSWGSHGYNPVTGETWYWAPEEYIGKDNALIYSSTIWDRIQIADNKYFHVGRFCHLIEDMASPAHAHADYHVNFLDVEDDVEAFAEHNYESAVFSVSTIRQPSTDGLSGFTDDTPDNFIKNVVRQTYLMTSYYGGNLVTEEGDVQPSSELKRMFPFNDGEGLRYDTGGLIENDHWIIDVIGKNYIDAGLGVNSDWWNCHGDSGYFYLENIDGDPESTEASKLGDGVVPEVFKNDKFRRILPTDVPDNLDTLLTTNNQILARIYVDNLFPMGIEWASGFLMYFSQHRVEEVKKLLASDGAAYDWFGTSVSISEDTVAVGAWGDDDICCYSGSVYIFERNQGGTDNWGELKKITAFDGSDSDRFGYSVSLSADTLVVGAYGDDGGGSAYIYRKNQGGLNNWGFVKKITASDREYGDNFGYSVCISGNTLVVGAINQDNENGLLAGSAYIFERDFGGIDNWGQVKKIIAPDGATQDQFGNSISISSNTVVVAAEKDDDNGNWSGSAYIFERNHGGTNNWGEVKKVIASDGVSQDYFGHSVSISGDTVLIGAHGGDDNGWNSGSAYIFERDHGGVDNWGEVKKIIALDGESPDFFGNSVSISGNMLIVGAYWEDENAYRSGSAYVFDRNEGGPNNWGQVQKILASDGEMWDQFGFSVSINGGTIVVGAEQDEDNGDDSGSAYVFVNNYMEPLPICEGDFDGDSDVDGSDLATFAADFARTDCGIGLPCEGDFEPDGDVDCSDLALFAADFGRTDCQ